jgi:hypothetical protein
MLHLAREQLQAGSIPPYLLKALPSEVMQRIVREAGLPQSLEVPLFEIAVAFDLALSRPPDDPKALRREIKDLFVAIDKLIGQLDELSADAQLTIWDFFVDDSAGEDQEWPAWFEPGVWGELSAVLRRARDAKAGIQIDHGSAGRRRSAFRMAAEAIIEAVEGQGTTMSGADLTRLVDALFHDVRVHHQSLSRSEDRDHDETPRSRDVIASILKERARHRA